MRKKALTFTALACALCLSVGLAACGGSDEVTEKKWDEAFGNAASYTVTTTLPMPDGSTSNTTVKVDGDKRLVSAHFSDGDGELYYSKENGEYFEYIVKPSLGVKVKLPMGTTQPMTAAQFDAMGGYLAVFKDDFASFTFADGKYTCASLDKTATSGAAFTNIAVTFEKGALTHVEYEAATTKIVIADIGKTGITLPQIGNGDDGNGNGDDGTTLSVAGKTFTYADVIGEGSVPPEDEEEIEQMKSSLSQTGITITFGTDNAVTIVQSGLGMTAEQTGTYVEDGDTVTITIETRKFNGESQAMEDDADPIVCKYDGTDFKFPMGGGSAGTGGEQAATYVIYVVLREQTA